MADIDIKQEVIDGVTERLKKEGPFATRDDVHNEIMDALKSVTVTPNLDVNGELTPKQIAEGKAMWYRQVLGYGENWGEKGSKAATGGWSTDVAHYGAELIPSIVANAIVEKLDNTPFRKLVTQYPYSPKGVVPYENALPAAVRMTTRGTAVTQGTATTAEVSYATNGLMAWIGLDNKLIREASPNTVEYLENAMVRAIARKEIIEFTQGVTGSKEMVGMGTTGAIHATGVNCVSTHLTVAALDAVDMLALFWSLEGMYADNAVFMAPNATLAKIATLNTAGLQKYLDLNTFKFMELIPTIRLPAACFAAPATAVPCAYYGDMKYYYLFQDGPIQIATTNQGFTAMTTDQTYICATLYSDGALILPEAVSALKYLT